MNIVKYLIELIVAVLLKIYNRIEQNRIKKVINEQKEKLGEILQKNHIAYNELMDDYDDYLRSGDETGEMRSDLEELHIGDEDPAGSNKESRGNNKGPGLLN